MLAQALSECGIADPSSHIIVVSDGIFCSVLFRATPWTLKDIAEYTWYCRTHPGMTLPYTPGMAGGNAFAEFMNAFNAGEENTFYADYAYDVSPVHDDNPFFFCYYKWIYLQEQMFSSGSGGSIGANWPVAMTLLSAMLIQGLAAVFLMIYFPLKGLKQSGFSFRHGLTIMGYFICIGIGYICVEMTLMQKLALYLGHPSYSISLVLTGLMVFSGFGSLLAGHFHMNSRITVPWILLAISIAILGIPSITALLATNTLHLPFACRLGISLCLTAVPGLLMGMPLPLGLVVLGGIRLADKDSGWIIPLAWGVACGANVVGSILAIALALKSGFLSVLILAAMCYCFAVAFFRFSGAHPG
jgi:hypothetical protein